MSHSRFVSRETFIAALRGATVVALGLGAAAFVPAGENWSRFRGPNGSGVARDVAFPAVWTEDDYQWKVTLPGKGHSSPIGWEGKLFLTSGDAATGELMLIALDAATGKSLWEQRFASTAQSQHAANSYASSTCAADAQRVYLVWAGPESLQLAALDHDGDEAWRRDLGPLDARHGFGVSPILVDDMVIVANDHSGESFVTALGARDGEPRWRRRRAAGTESYATPAVWRGDGGGAHIIVNSTAEGMAGLAPADGSVLWQLPAVFPARCVASPIVVDDLVMGGSGEGGNGKSFVAVRPATAVGAEAQVAYEVKKSIPQVPTPVALGELLFIWNDRGVVSCCDLATGNVHWTERVGGNYYSSPIVAGEKLYGIAADGQAVVLAATAKYQLLGRNSLGEAASATPAVHQGKMYLRTETSLACLAPAK